MQRSDALSRPAESTLVLVTSKHWLHDAFGRCWCGRSDDVRGHLSGQQQTLGRVPQAIDRVTLKETAKTLSVGGA